MYFAYTRVSTIEQSRPEKTSLQEQERQVRGFAMMQGINAYDIQVFSDPGVSGSIALSERPAGKKMLEMVQPGDTIVASKLDRIFRDLVDAVLTYKAFKEKNIGLILLDLGTDSITADSGTSKLIFNVMSAFADHERIRIKERMRDGKLAKAANGGSVGGKTPIGFRVVGKGRSARFVENPEEQKIIEAVKARKAESPSQIKKALDAEGFVNRKGRPFDVRQVKRFVDRLTFN